MKPCKICVIDSGGNPLLVPSRPAPHPGPRCATHHREFVKEKKKRAHANRTEKTFGITGEQYWEIYKAQNGKCFICRRATGATRSLAVDHDHGHCSGKLSCGECVRALLCSSCNRGVLGHLHDDVEALRRAIEVIERHPAQDVLKGLKK